MSGSAYGRGIDTWEKCLRLAPSTTRPVGQLTYHWT